MSRCPPPTKCLSHSDRLQREQNQTKSRSLPWCLRFQRLCERRTVSTSHSPPWSGSPRRRIVSLHQQFEFKRNFALEPFGPPPDMLLQQRRPPQIFLFLGPADCPAPNRRMCTAPSSTRCSNENTCDTQRSSSGWFTTSSTTASAGDTVHIRATVVHASPVPKYLARHQGGSFVAHLGTGVLGGTPLPQAGPAADSRSLRERLVPHSASLSRAASR